MKRAHRIIFSFCVAISLVSRAAAETTFAAILPLTGNVAEQGEWARRGFDIALQELKSQGQTDINLRYEDSKGADPATAVQAYRAIVLQNKVSVVFTYGSGVAMALSPLTNSDHVIQMGIATATPKYRSEGDYTFRNFPSATLEADFLAESLAGKLAAREIAVININNDYGVGTSGAAESAFALRGGKVIFKESYNPGETDFRSMLMKLRKFEDAIVYLAVYPADGALLLKQARELGLHQQFISSVAIIGGNDFFTLAGNAAEGLIVASTAGDTNNPFVKLYNAKYQKESPAQQIYAARAYDALMLVGAALKECKSENSDCLRDALTKVRDYDGASGRVSFDTAGDISTSFSLFRVHGTNFETLTR